MGEKKLAGHTHRELNRDLAERGLNGGLNVPFAEGNSLGLLHGGYSSGRAQVLRDAAIAARDQLRGVLAEDYDDRFVFAVDAAGITLAKIDRAVSYHDRLEAELEAGEISSELFHDRMRSAEEALGRSIRDLRRWLADLGLTPAAESQITRDRGVGADAGSRAAERVRRHLESRRGEDESPALESGAE